MYKTPVHTLQFPNFGKLPRRAFLAVVHRHVTTFALQRQEILTQLGGHAGHFHTLKSHPTPVPVLIHSLQKDGLLTLRAYTQPAISTLLIWHKLFQEAQPEYCSHTIETKEIFTYRQQEKPFFYKSTNWIPYRNLTENGKEYVDKDTGKQADFSSRLTGNLRTYVKNLGLESPDLHLEVSLKNINPNHKTRTALIKKQEDGLLPITKYAFGVTLATNVALPVYFSLGQNVGYGNGVFERI